MEWIQICESNGLMDFAHWSFFSTFPSAHCTMASSTNKGTQNLICAIDGITNKTSDCAEGIFCSLSSFLPVFVTQKTAILECEINCKISFSIRRFTERKLIFDNPRDFEKRISWTRRGNCRYAQDQKIRFKIMSLLARINVCVCLSVCLHCAISGTFNVKKW